MKHESFPCITLTNDGKLWLGRHDWPPKIGVTSGPYYTLSWLIHPVFFQLCLSSLLVFVLLDCLAAESPAASPMEIGSDKLVCASHLHISNCLYSKMVSNREAISWCMIGFSVEVRNPLCAPHSAKVMSNPKGKPAVHVDYGCLAFC